MRRLAQALGIALLLATPAAPALARPSPTPPVTWYRQVASGGLGADPRGVRALTAATFPLPASRAGCGGLLLPRRADDVVVRVETFGVGGRRQVTVTFGRPRPSAAARSAVSGLLASL